MATHNPNRLWEACLKKATSRKTRNKLRFEVKKIQKTKQGLSSTFLISTLCTVPNFIGVFSQDFLLSLQILTFPVSFIINLDLSSESGSHWIAIIINENSIEVLDSFGLDRKTWKREPLILFTFLKKFSKSHKIRVLPRYQSSDSNLCGVYCVFFLIFRLKYSFFELQKIFSTDLNLNSSVLLSYFQ